MNRGTSNGSRFLARWIGFPPKSAPRDNCALRRFSASSTNIGINRRAIDITKANSATGTRMYRSGENNFSKPAVISIGAVVNVNNADAITMVHNRNEKKPPFCKPSIVASACMKGSSQIVVPGVKKVWSPKVNVSNQTKARRFERTEPSGNFAK